MIAFVSECDAILTGRYVPPISMKVTRDKRHMHVLNIDLNAQCGTAYTCPYVALVQARTDARMQVPTRHVLCTAEAMSPSVHSHVAFDLAALSSRDALVAIVVGQQEQQQRPTTRSTSGDRPLANDNGDGGAQWFRRWRHEYGIIYKTSGMQIKVSWSKILKRVKVLLDNISRTRAFWDWCHHGKLLKSISLDQKPSWHNNAGQNGTLGKKGEERYSMLTRERYSILTLVRNFDNDDTEEPAPLEVLFSPCVFPSSLRYHS